MLTFRNQHWRKERTFFFSLPVLQLHAFAAPRQLKFVRIHTRVVSESVHCLWNSTSKLKNFIGLNENCNIFDTATFSSLYPVVTIWVFENVIHSGLAGLMKHRLCSFIITGNSGSVLWAGQCIAVRIVCDCDLPVEACVDRLTRVDGNMFINNWLHDWEIDAIQRY